MTQEAENKLIEYESNGQSIKLSPSIVRRYLISGDATNVTDEEVIMYLNLCRYQRLNPFLREAYCIKYGREPATMVVGKGTYEKRAARNKLYGGFEAGVIVTRDDKLDHRVGSLVLDGETLVGGWARVHVKGYDVPVESAVSFSEYAGRKSNGDLNGQWTRKPGTMIRKVALVQALREAFPEDLEGLPYAEEEMDLKDRPGSTDIPVSGESLELPPEMLEINQSAKQDEPVAFKKEPF
ncbi:MAG: phage recombination protein Bet [Eubacteriales bacterium]|nr:phage recombination protein Bet [Eubacteriales bacterium]